MTMNRFFSLNGALLATATVITAALGIAAPASAQTTGNLFYAGTSDLHPAGVGTVATILSLQRHGNNTTETGSVAWNGTSDVKTGDWTTGSNTQTHTLSSIGINQASDVSLLQLILNINEPNGGNKADISIAPGNLVLTAYDGASGASVFSTSLGGSTLKLTETGNGIGTADAVFKLDETAAQGLFQVYRPDLRIGLYASIDGANGGFETFSLAKSASGGEGPVGPGGTPVGVPEPGLPFAFTLFG